MRCLRPTLPRSHPPTLPRRRPFHSTPPPLNDSEEPSEPAKFHPSLQQVEAKARETDNNHTIDESTYARDVTRRSMARWEESQEPKGRYEFFSFGREFTVPYNLTEIAYQDLNHQRELRTYYRKIMYEMPQFKRISS